MSKRCTFAAVRAGDFTLGGAIFTGRLPGHLDVTAQVCSVLAISA